MYESQNYFPQLAAREREDELNQTREIELQWNLHRGRKG